MKSREWIWTTSALLALVCASTAFAQPDHNGPDPGQVKRADKGEQGQAKGQAHKPAPAPRQRTAQRPAMPGRLTQPVGQRTRVGVQAASPRMRSALPERNRLTPPSRQVVAAPVQSRPGTSRAEQRSLWPRFRAKSWTSQHQSWDQRGGYHGYRIPSAQFVLRFGRTHRFHLSGSQVRVVGSYPEFHANGFWFTLLDPVPEYWGDDWYDTDDVSVVQMGDGYYLVDESYPDVMVTVSVGT